MLFLWSLPLAIRQQMSVDQEPLQSHWPRIQSEKGYEFHIPMDRSELFKTVLFDSRVSIYGTHIYKKQATIIIIS